MTQEAPRCQVVVRDVLQVAVGGKQTDAARERVCGLPMARNLAGVGVFVCPVHGAPVREGK